VRNRTRLGCLILLLLVSIVELRWVSHDHPVPLRRDFDTFPTHVGDWSGEDQERSPRVKVLLAADNYILRTYNNNFTGMHVDLLIAYYSSDRDCYSSRRTGDTLHSPGVGWTRVSSDVVQVPNPAIPGQAFTASHYLIKKAGVYIDVLSWCQVHGRIFATEPKYLSRVHLVWDGITKGGTTGSALIRLTAVRASENDQPSPAMIAFAQDLSSVLPQFLPN
jgi:EpsI family protein